MLARAMRSEPSLVVLSALLQQAEWLLARFATPDQAASASALLETAAANIPGLTPDAERYLSELPDQWRTRPGHLRVQLAHALFPYPAVSPELVTSIDRFLDAGGVDPGLARILRDHRDTAERVLRARALFG
jgi:hypothetical protein